MPFPDIEDLIRQGHFGAAEQLILAFSADAEGVDRALLAGHLAELAGEHSRAGRTEDTARALNLIKDLGGQGLELPLARAGLSLMNAWIDRGASPEAASVLNDMPGGPLVGPPHPDPKLERLLFVGCVNLLSSLADQRDIEEAEALFQAMGKRGMSPENSDLFALAALNLVILYVHAGRPSDADALAREMEGYGDGEEAKEYCARARKILSGLDGAP
ncbi:MAG: hypothetical protein LBQ12_05935 [Deltaproteobacteria bacterium]|jgi:pentatricopeptide repeat protein|nr:hypothetical protein [Deltaproteobacteria bacterium]